MAKILGFLLFFLLSYCCNAFSFSNGISYRGTQAQRSEFRAFLERKLIEASSRVASRAMTSSFDEALNKHANTSAETIAAARKLVAESIRQASEYNKARVLNPLRNNYVSQHSPAIQRRENTTNYPLMTVNSTLASAAALVAEVDAAAQARNGTLFSDYSKIDDLWSKKSGKTKKRATSSYWLAKKQNLGTWPYGSDSSYQVFRNVMDYGATGNGVTDDTAAINSAIAAGNRCGASCESSTVKGAIIFFPAGTYLVSSSIISLYNTQLVGDPTNLPTIVAAASFVGLGVITTDVYANGTSEWYIDTSNFYRQIRNFQIDITRTDQNAYVCAIHYQVAQASSIQNVALIATQSASTTQQGMYTENGSGGFMSDILFYGGNFGLWGGNQQFTTRNMIFHGCNTAMQLIWDWGWTWQGLQIESCAVGISLLGQDGTTRGTGSLMLLDSVFADVPVAILTFAPLAGAGKGTTGISMNNVAFKNVGASIKDNTGTVIYPGSITSVDGFNLGNEYSAKFYGQWSEGTVWETKRDPSLTYSASWANGLPHQPYLQQSMPQYENMTIGNIVQFKWSAKGDGVTDDTAAIQAILDALAGTSKIGYIDAGSYLITDTLVVHPGTILVGECWPQFVASGPNFQDPFDPRPLLQVGNNGDVGSVEIQQLLFTTTGPTEGLIAVEWNILASSQGSAALWDSHVRIGGALGSKLQVSQCPTGSVNDGCIAASLMFHVTNGASGYFENMWLWTADHDIDDSKNNMVSVFVGRGILVESNDPVWMYGTASEHSTLYQYQFRAASNVVAGMIHPAQLILQPSRTETPYYQPNPAMCSPFTERGMNMFRGDPVPGDCWASGEGCDSAYGLRFYYASNITIYGAGLYSFFNDYTQACIDTQNCQSTLVSIDHSYAGINIFNLNTIGAVNMVTGYNLVKNQSIPAAINTDSTGHPYWSGISYLEGQITTDPDVATVLGDLQNAFPGIWWNEAVPGARSGCQNWEDFNILLEATRMANEMVRGSPIYDDLAFNRFFISPGNKKIKFGWSKYYPGEWAMLQNIMNAISRIITTAPDKNKQLFKITYACKDGISQDHCKPNIPAYTFNANGEIADYPGYAQTITFCPRFFQNRYINDIIRAGPKDISILGHPNYYSYEGTIIHELTHCNLSMELKGDLNTVVDIISPATGKKVYGARQAADFGWYKVQNLVPPWNGPTVNSRAPHTAETWAWMYQNRFYQNVWNWGGQGIPEELTLYSPYLTDGDNEGQVDTDDGSDPAVPPNCIPAGTSTQGYSLVNCTFPN